MKSKESSKKTKKKRLTLQLAVSERGTGDEREEREEEGDGEAGHFFRKGKREAVFFFEFFFLVGRSEGGVVSVELFPVFFFFLSFRSFRRKNITPLSETKILLSSRSKKRIQLHEIANRGGPRKETEQRGSLVEAGLFLSSRIFGFRGVGEKLSRKVGSALVARSLDNGLPLFLRDRLEMLVRGDRGEGIKTKSPRKSD